MFFHYAGLLNIHIAYIDVIFLQIDAHNKKGCTALWLACHGGHLETAQTLVKHDADVDARDNRRVSPLIIAFRKGHVKVGIFFYSSQVLLSFLDVLFFSAFSFV